MTSPCELHIYCDDPHRARAIAMKILDMAKKLEQKYNFYNNSSYLSAINRREVDTLDHQTKELLSRAKQFYHKTGGIFDITMGTLVSSRREKSIKKIESKLEEMRPFVGVDHFKIKKNRISFDNPYTLIDLGGFVKEFAVDQAVKLLRRDKIESALINFGGDIYALGRKPNGKEFTIGIKNPHSPSEYITHVKLENRALTTSASYERNHIVEGKIYSHIIHTEELQEEIASATVISTTAVESGVYSTSLMINPKLKTSLEKILIDSTRL